MAIPVRGEQRIDAILAPPKLDPRAVRERLRLAPVAHVGLDDRGPRSPSSASTADLPAPDIPVTSTIGTGAT